MNFDRVTGIGLAAFASGVFIACSSPHEEPGASTSSPLSGDDHGGYIDDGECADPSSLSYGTCQLSYVRFSQRGTVGARQGASIEIHLGAEGVATLGLSGTYFDETKVTYVFDGTEYQALKNPSEMRFEGPVDKVFTVIVRNDGPGSINWDSAELDGSSDSSAHDVWCTRYPPDVRPDLSSGPYCFSAE